MSRADVLAGRAYVSLFVKQDGLTRGLQKARADLNKFGSDMMTLGARMVAATAAIAAPVAFATKTFADFDDAMRAVGAVSRASAEDLASMTAVAKDLGATTSFTAVQVAQLMTELGRAGFSPDQINAMTGAVMNLARATGTDATLASGIMAASIRQFNLDATDAARVADVLTLAANSTFNTVEGLGESLKYAGPVAAELGMSLEDTVAILGSLGNVGIQGSEAGTALRRLGVISAATGEKLKKTFGISNVDAAGNLKPLVQIMDEIGKSLDGISVAEKVAKMNEAFGLLGITSASVLARSAGDTTSLAESLKNAEGAAAKTAAEMDAGIGGSFRIIMSAAEGLQIALGESLAGSIKSVTETITGLLSQATEWVNRNRDVVVSLAVITAGAGATGVAILGIAIAAKAAAVAVGVMTAAYGAARAAIVATIIVAKAWAAVSFAIGSAIYVHTSAVALLSLAASASSAAAGVMATAWSAAGTVISAVWAVITAPIFPFIVAAGIAVGIVTALAAAAAYLTIRGTDFSGAWGVVTATLRDLMDVAKRVGGILMESLGSGDYDIAARAAFAGIKIAFADMVDAMSEMWAMFFEGAWSVSQRFLTNFAQVTYNTIAAVSSSLSNPLTAAMTMKGAIDDIASRKISLSLTLNTKGIREGANAELDALEKELEARQVKREAEKKTEAAGGGKGGAGGAAGSGGDGIPVGGANQVGDESTAGAAEAAATAFDRETEALQQQIIALRQGEEAAERFRLAKQGLTDAEIEQVMALRAEEEALRKQQDASRRVVDQIQDVGDAVYKAQGLTPEEVAKREKASIEIGRQQGLIDDQTAKDATAEADIRAQEKMHQERLKLIRGEGGVDPGSKFKAGGASSATFSAASLVSQGFSAGDRQMQIAMGTKKAIEDQTKKTGETAKEIVAAIKTLGLHHA